MAAYRTAIARINYLAGNSTRHQATPNTINGYGDVIRSYGLMIAFRDNPSGDWLVRTDADSTLTTNRHIRAAHMAFGMTTKYTNVGTEDQNGTLSTRYQRN